MLQNSALAEDPRYLYVQPTISFVLKHLHPSRQAVSEAIMYPTLSYSPGIETQFGFFVIFKNQICLGTKFQQQLFLLFVLCKDI
jgi:hypothetical protein